MGRRLEFASRHTPTIDFDFYYSLSLTLREVFTIFQVCLNTIAMCRMNIKTGFACCNLSSCSCRQLRDSFNALSM